MRSFGTVKNLGFASYSEYLQSWLWTNKRDFMLDQFPVCYKCKEEKAVCVHHKTYERVGNEGIRDLITLCKNCHEKEHGK